MTASIFNAIKRISDQHDHIRNGAVNWTKWSRN